MSDRRSKTLRALASAIRCNGPVRTPADQRATIEALTFTLASVSAAEHVLGADQIQVFGNRLLEAVDELAIQIKSEIN